MNLKKRAASLQDLWSPEVVGQVNDQFVKVAKVQGELAWHQHRDEDEMFLVLEGTLRIEYEDRVVDLEEGDFHIVPKGTLHNPTCESECLIALIETTTTQHTGDLETEKTRSIEDQVRKFSGPSSAS